MSSSRTMNRGTSVSPLYPVVPLSFQLRRVLIRPPPQRMAPRRPPLHKTPPRDPRRDPPVRNQHLHRLSPSPTCVPEYTGPERRREEWE